MSSVADAQVRAHTRSSSVAEAFEEALREELLAEAIFVGTSSQAEVRIQLLDAGRRLIVRDETGRLLVQRRLAQAGPPSNRVFVALAAQAVRAYVPELPQLNTATPAVSSRRISQPFASGLARRKTPRPVPVRPPDLGRIGLIRFVVGAEVQVGTWTKSGPLQGGFALSGALVGARWTVRARVAGQGGAVLKTQEVQADLKGVQAAVEGAVKLVRLGPVQVGGQLGLGLGQFWGTTAAVEPAFASPGSTTTVRLFEPALIPGLSFGVRVSDRVGFYLRMSAKIALATHRIGLPASFGFSDAAPVETARIQPWAAIGIDWQLF